MFTKPATTNAGLVKSFGHPANASACEPAAMFCLFCESYTAPRLTPFPSFPREMVERFIAKITRPLVLYLTGVPYLLLTTVSMLEMRGGEPLYRRIVRVFTVGSK